METFPQLENYAAIRFIFYPIGYSDCSLRLCVFV